MTLKLNTHKRAKSIYHDFIFVNKEKNEKNLLESENIAVCMN